MAQLQIIAQSVQIIQFTSEKAEDTLLTPYKHVTVVIKYVHTTGTTYRNSPKHCSLTRKMTSKSGVCLLCANTMCHMGAHHVEKKILYNSYTYNFFIRPIFRAVEFCKKKTHPLKKVLTILQNLFFHIW